MALYIKYKDGGSITLNLPFRQFEMNDIERFSDGVQSVYADGHEHERILQRFKNLPSGHAYTKWTGEFALFIAANALLLLDSP